MEKRAAHFAVHESKVGLDFVVGWMFAGRGIVLGQAQVPAHGCAELLG